MLTTVLLIVLILFLVGGFFPWGAGPPVAPGQPMAPAPLYRGYGYGWGLGGPLGHHPGDRAGALAARPTVSELLDHVITVRDILVVSCISVVVILTLFAIGTAIARVFVRD